MGPSEVQSARLFTVPDTAVVDVVLNFLSPETKLLDHTSNHMTRAPSPDPISRKTPASMCTTFFFLLEQSIRPQSEALNRIRIRISLVHNFAQQIWAPWCTPVSVAKRQQFSRPSSRTTLSLSLKMCFQSVKCANIVTVVVPEKCGCSSKGFVPAWYWCQYHRYR